jgi:hypothetical protein
MSSRVTYIAHQIIATGQVAHTGRAYLDVAATDAQLAQSQGQDLCTPGVGLQPKRVARNSPNWLLHRSPNPSIC